ncbi:MAG: beta-galactosidase [Sulfolobales archaeon]
MAHTPPRTRVYPLGLWYGVGKITPIFDASKIRDDLKKIKELGVGFIRFWVNWRDIEPRPSAYEFGRLKEAMDVAEEIGLSVVLQVYLEFGPDWLSELYPDAVFVSESELKLHHQGSPGVCLDHPSARRHAERFLAELAKFAKRYSSLYAWDVWSEPQIVQWVFRLGLPKSVYCYCEHSVRRFREWLKEVYGSISALNTAWHRSFNSFEDVQPPRFVVLHYARENIDWVEFNVWKLKEDLRWRVETIKKVDQEHLVASHAATSSVLLNPLFGHPDDWEMSKVVDVWGTSLYPKHAHRVPDPVVDSFILTSVRSSADAWGKSFWVGELQGGQGVGGLKIADVVRPEDINVWFWQSVAHGSKGVFVYHSYPVMWGYESSGYGLLDPAGNLTDRARALAHVSSIVREYGDILSEARPLKAKCALLYNKYSYRLLWVLQEESAAVFSRSLLGVYRALYKYNVPVDVVSVEQFISNRGNYMLLIAPFSIAVSKELSSALERFVSSGGVLLVDARFGWFKEDGWIDEEIPSYGLSRVLGAREKSCRSLTEQKAAMRVVNEVIPGLKRGDTVGMWYYAETMELSSSNAMPIAEVSSAETALTINNYGRGFALWVGTSVGLAYENVRDLGVEKLIKGVVELAGVRPPVMVDPVGALEVRVLTMGGGSERLVIIINHGLEEVRAKIAFPEDKWLEKIGDIITGKSYVVKGGELELSVPPRGVIVGYSRQ